MMLSGLATVPWLTEMVKFGSVAGPELPLPWVTAQMMRATATMTATAMAP